MLTYRQDGEKGTRTMKELNVIRYIAEMSTQINGIIKATSECEDIEKARRLANRAAGYVEALTVMSNTMICFENNGLTAQIGELEDEFMAKIYQALCDVSVRINDTDLFFRYAEKRDEYTA